MALTNAGRDLITQAVIGEAITAFNNANGCIGVGESTTTFNATHTNLQGSTRLRKGMDTTYPTRATNVVTLRATFATSEANWAWQEWGWFNNVTDAAGVMLTRKVESLGTKTSAQSWQVTATMTFTAA